MDHHPFTWFEHLLPGVTHENLHMFTSGFIALLLAVAAFVVYPRMKHAAKAVIPDGHFSLRNFFELLVGMLDQLAKDVIGHGHRKYLPFIGTMFIFIFFSNLVGLIPGFLPPTETWVMGAAIATISFIAFNYFGFREHGLGYFSHFVAPISLKGVKNPIAWFLILIPLLAFQVLFASVESISMFLRPVTLSIRLLVNITADHKILEVFGAMAPYIVPIPVMIMGIFVSFMQAFIFTMLTMVYISMSVSHDH
ncbi:MAG: F0F1 ATP synthase subunit A [Bdellovibrionales bacterium]|nr:F0F1 ATP synthase subunit A [Bdellovibrionales bacterium]